MSSTAASPNGVGPGEDSFRLGVHEDGATRLLCLDGVFEWGSVGRVEAAVDEASRAHASRVVFDLRGLRALDLAGLRTLLRANERARAERFEVIVVRAPPPVSRIFTLTRAGRELTMVDSFPPTA